MPFDGDKEIVPGLPGSVVETYARLWQLETSLRQMVYVELRALRGDDWHAGLLNQAERPLEADRALTHMPTPEEHPLSYVSFASLCKIIEENWNLFDAFLPPERFWSARIEEVKQVRNRVAHFRRGHHDDLQRVCQLLRDLDRGFWRFVTSYNDEHPIAPAEADPVAFRFLDLDPFRSGGDNDAAFSHGLHYPGERMDCLVRMLARPWANRTTGLVAGSPGYLYDVQIIAHRERQFDYHEFLAMTRPVHSRLVHLCMDGFCQHVRVTIPAVLGSGDTIALIERLLQATDRSLHSARTNDSSECVQRLSEEWPEYVLGPRHPLTFLCPDNPCTMFAA